MSIHNLKLMQRLESLVSVTASAQRKSKLLTTWHFSFLHVMNWPAHVCVHYEGYKRNTWEHYPGEKQLGISKRQQVGTVTVLQPWPRLKPYVGTYLPSSSVPQQVIKSNWNWGHRAAANLDLDTSWSEIKISVPNLKRYFPFMLEYL